MVFTGADVARMKTEGPDQRIKVFFPLPGQDVPPVPSGEDWYPRYRALPDDRARPCAPTRSGSCVPSRARSTLISCCMAKPGRPRAGPSTLARATA